MWLLNYFPGNNHEEIFNNFYHEHSVLKADEKIKLFRLKLIGLVEQVMSKGLHLLGIETVSKM